MTSKSSRSTVHQEVQSRTLLLGINIITTITISLPPAMLDREASCRLCYQVLLARTTLPTIELGQLDLGQKRTLGHVP